MGPTASGLTTHYGLNINLPESTSWPGSTNLVSQGAAAQLQDTVEQGGHPGYWLFLLVDTR